MSKSPVDGPGPPVSIEPLRAEHWPEVERIYAAPPLLQRMVDAGLLGRKTGRGFYTYD